MKSKSIVAVAAEAVPERVRRTARLVVHPIPEEPKVTSAHRMKAARRSTTTTPSSAEIAARVAKRVGARTNSARPPQSGDVEFSEKTPIGKRSIVVQVRGGRVTQVLKRATRP